MKILIASILFTVFSVSSMEKKALTEVQFLKKRIADGDQEALRKLEAKRARNRISARKARAKRLLLPQQENLSTSGRKRKLQKAIDDGDEKAIAYLMRESHRKRKNSIFKKQIKIPSELDDYEYSLAYLDLFVPNQLRTIVFPKDT